MSDNNKQPEKDLSKDASKKEAHPPASKDKKDPKAPKEEELVFNHYSPIFIPYLQNEEDQALKEKIDLLVERLRDHEEAQRLYALSEIKKEVAGATTSMTSVPKPLKFLCKHYNTLKETYALLPAGTDFKVSLMNIYNTILIPESHLKYNYSVNQIFMMNFIG